MLVITDALREEVVRGAASATLRRLAEEVGMGSMVEDARRKVAEGVTTPHEVGRVLQTDAGAALPCAGCGADVPTGAPACPVCGRIRVRVCACACGRVLRPGWRYCAWCVRRVSHA